MPQLVQIVVFFSVVFSILLFFFNQDQVRQNHPNQCAMTYFNQELIPQQYAHPFYEIAEFRLTSPMIQTAYELYSTDQALLQKSTTKSFPTHPTPPHDETQHLIFFFPGNAGNRWQARSLGTKLDNYIGNLYRQMHAFPFDGTRPRVDKVDPNLVEMPPRIAHAFASLTATRNFRSPKAYFSKFSKINVTNPETGLGEEFYHDTTKEMQNIPDFSELLQLNNDPTMPTMLQTTYIDNHFYTFNFNEQMGAFSGLSLESQQEYAVYAITRLVSRFRRQYNGKVQISLVGHSMGGVVALSSVEQLNAAFKHEKYRDVAVSSVVTMGTPVTPLYVPDYHSTRIYDEAHRFLNNHENCGNTGILANPIQAVLGGEESGKDNTVDIVTQGDDGFGGNPTAPRTGRNDAVCNVAVSQFDGDIGDEMVPALFSGSNRFQYNTHTLAVSTTEISTMRATVSHDTLAYCGQVLEHVAVLLLRKVLLDTITVSKLDLDAMPPASVHLFQRERRPNVIYIPHDENLLFKSYDKTKRIEFQSVLTRSLPRHLLPKQARNIFPLPQRIVEPDTAKNDIVITFNNIIEHLDGLLYHRKTPITRSQLQTSLPPLIRNVDLTTVSAHHASENAFVLVSQFPSTFQLCQKSALQSQCASLHKFRQMINTPAYTHLTYKSPHTLRASSGFTDKVLSRSSLWNQDNDQLPGDEGWLQPAGTNLSQHGSVTVFTFHQVYQFAQSQFDFRDSFSDFVQQYQLQILISPEVLEGIVGIPTYLEIPGHLLNYNQDWLTPIVWSTTQVLPKSSLTLPEPSKPGRKAKPFESQLFKYQLTLGNSVTNQPFSPTLNQCVLFSSLLVSEFAFPIVSFDISILYTTPTSPNTASQPYFHIAQTDQLAPESPYIECVQTYNQRYLQGAPANAIIDIVLGRVAGRHSQAEKIPYDASEDTPSTNPNPTATYSFQSGEPTNDSPKQPHASKKISLFSEATLGALPIPASLVDNISGSTRVVNPAPKANKLNREVVLLPEAIDKPYLPRFFKNVSKHLLSLHFSLIAFSVQLAVLIAIWQVIQYHRSKRYLSSFIDYYEEKDVKKAVFGMKYSPLASRDPASSVPSHAPSLTDDDGDDEVIIDSEFHHGHHAFSQLNDDSDSPTESIADIKPLLPKTLPPRLTKKTNTAAKKSNIKNATADKEIKAQPRCKSFITFFKPVVKFVIGAALAAAIVICVVFPFVLQSNPQLKHTIPSPILVSLKPIIEIHHLAVMAIKAAQIPQFFEILLQFASQTIIPLARHIYNFLSPILLPTLKWCYSWVSWIEYLVNHSASPIAILRPQSEIEMSDVEYYTTMIVYYYLAFCFAHILLFILGVVKTILSFPFATYIAFNGTLFGMLQDIFFPLALLFGYTLPLLGLFIYSTSSVFTQFFRSTYLGANLAHTSIAQTIIQFHVGIHCFFKQGVYYLIHYMAQFLLSIFKSPSSFIVVNMNEYPKYHMYPQTITYFQHVLTDFELYTKPSILPGFQCMVHPEDYQLLPIPISTATILFFTVIWTLLFVLFVSILTSYDFKQYKTFLSKYYDKQEAQVKANNSTGTENEDEAEQHYMLSRILHRDWTLNFQLSNTKTFLIIFFTILLSVLMILPSARVISESTELSMKQNQYRQLYQHIQSQTITPLELQTRLDRHDITRAHFNTYGTETVSFSIFYSFLTKFYPSQLHNPYAKYMLTAQWYQQRAAWAPIVPTDLMVHLNFYTTFAFTFLLAIQLAASLAYFIYLDNTKARAIDFVRALKTPVPFGSNSIPRIQRNPRNFQLLIRLVYLVSYATTAAFTCVVILPLFIPWLLGLNGELTPNGADVYINNFSYRILQTPYQQSLITLPLLFAILLHLIYLSFDTKLVIPNEVERGYKPNPVA